MKANKIKTAAGLVLVLLSIAALLFWEAAGRELLMMDSVLIAESDIKEGEPVSAERFRTVSAPAGTLVDGAVTPKNVSALAGMEAAADIVKGAQLSLRHLKYTSDDPKPETSYFVIRNEWISMCTSSLRRGDDVFIISADGKTEIGRFHVAYVKDGDGREVTDASSGMYSFTGTDSESGRVNTSAPIHHVEIECELGDYRRILDYCSGKAAAPLMLVRMEGGYR
ncbi:MAG: SAF domain-containing protein [Clostridiales bacterium]|nr:SAF domain-containing protein [Clostridiales bacterium]